MLFFPFVAIFTAAWIENAEERRDARTTRRENNGPARRNSPQNISRVEVELSPAAEGDGGGAAATGPGAAPPTMLSSEVLDAIRAGQGELE